MAENLVIDDITYNNVESISATNDEGQSVQYYNDAVRYTTQTLTNEQKAQARTNVDVYSKGEVDGAVGNLTTRLNTLADSDDTTLDQLSEIVAYIKSNKSLIDGVTTGKVNVADIIDNLTTNATDKPLSAAQGVVLKALIDAIVVPTTASEVGAAPTIQYGTTEVSDGDTSTYPDGTLYVVIGE